MGIRNSRKKELTMLEFTTITLPKTMPLTERISEVSRQISEWLESLEIPFNDEKDVLRLTRYERNDEKHSYHYSVDRGASVSDANKSP